MSQTAPVRDERFELLAWVLLPVDRRPSQVLPAGPSWNFDRESLGPGVEAVVWGAAPLPYGVSVRLAARSAANRERALYRVRRRVDTPHSLLAVHRPPPPSAGAATVRRRVRAALFGGMLVELGAERWERALDAAAAAAGAPGRVSAFQSGSGGAAIALVRLGTGQPAILRVARAGSTGDPHGASIGLKHLQEHQFSLAPLPLGHGTVADVAWSAESYMPGRHPSRMTPRLARDVERAWAKLPRLPSAPVATGLDLGKIASRLPQHSSQVKRLAESVQAVAASLPSLVRHGDLWIGNLRAVGGELTGVIDWDSLHPAGMPGADLLQLYGNERQMSTATSLGAVWLSKPWTDDDFRTWTATYWRELGITTTDDVLHAIGVAWWATQVSGTLDRLPHRANDVRWVTANVEAVLSHLRA